MISDFRLVGLTHLLIMLVVGLAVDEGHYVGVLLNGAGFAQIAEDGALVVLRAARRARESCERATTGTFSSLAKAFRPREIARPPGCGSIVPFAEERHCSRHQLQIVDDDQVEAAGVLPEPPGFGAHLGQRNGRCVVDEDPGLNQLAQRGLQLFVIFAARKPFCSFCWSTQACEANMRRSSDSLFISRLKTATMAPWLMAAFWAMLMARAVLPIEGRAAMMISSPFCRPLVRRSNSVKSVASPVTRALLVQIVDRSEGVLDDLIERLEAVGEALLSDLHQLRLGGAQDLERGFALVGGAGNGHGADAHQLAQQALVLDDADVLLDDRRRGKPSVSEAR